MEENPYQSPNEPPAIGQQSEKVKQIFNPLRAFVLFLLLGGLTALVLSPIILWWAKLILRQY